MLKKTITFEDLDGNVLTEDFYFQITKAEVAMMQLSFEGGFAEYLMKMAKDPKPNGKLIMDTFHDFIKSSVGRRSEDGRRFIKSQEITDDFMQSDAYNVFFMELVTDAQAGIVFVKGIMPKDMAESITDEPTTIELPAADVSVTTVTKPKDPSEMSVEELREAYRQKNSE